jgi:DeoR family fructose operon transcriptional repressor
MLTQERRAQILNLLEEKGAVTVLQLCEIFNASESTIRRDLVALSNLGQLKKVHGGAMVSSQEFLRSEEQFEEKSTKYVDEKTKIAQYAALQINDDDFVFVDAGSTTYLMTKYIKDTKATFVTNGIAHAKELSNNGCKVFVLGGELKKTTEAIIGLVAASNLQKYNFSKAFIGANGISIKQGYTTPDTEEAMLKAVALERSFISYVLADSSKFNKVSAVSFASLDSACIICDKCDDDELKDRFVVKEVI